MEPKATQVKFDKSNMVVKEKDSLGKEVFNVYNACGMIIAFFTDKEQADKYLDSLLNPFIGVKTFELEDGTIKSEEITPLKKDIEIRIANGKAEIQK